MYTFKITDVTSAEELLQMKMLYSYNREDDALYYMTSKRTGDRYDVVYNKETGEYSVGVKRKEKNYEGVEDWRVVFKCLSEDEFEIKEAYRVGNKLDDVAEVKKFAYVVFCVGVLLYNKIIDFN